MMIKVSISRAMLNLLQLLQHSIPLANLFSEKKRKKTLSGYMEQYSGSEIFLLLSMTLKEMRFYLKGIFRTIRAFILTCIRNIEKVLMVIKRSEEHTSELQSRPHLVCRL